MFPSPTALVTGATGFLGLNLVRELTAAGWRVTALHRPDADLKYLGRFPVTRAVATLEDPSALDRAMPEGLDAVFHPAADLSSWHGHRDRQTRTNVDGTRHLVDLAVRRGVKKFVHTSTTSVYGLPRQPFDETAPHLGRGSGFHYQHTKALAEEEVRAGIARGLDAVILNPANIVGSYDYRSSWSRLIVLAAEGRLPAVPPGGGSFCHAAAVAKAHVAAVTRGRRGENYILGGADASYRELVLTLAEVMGKPLKARTVGPVILRLAGWTMGLVSRFTGREPFVTPDAASYLCATLIGKSDKAVRELGYEPVPLRAMLEDSYRWLVAEGLISTAASPASPSAS
ncbi:MAG: NAD-dependent epimerase/dehydratase family protein [Gemmataceae bacterium]